MSEYVQGTSDEKLLEKAKRCFKLACDSEAKQREREREDLRFQIPEEQWTEAAKKERAGGNGIPPRPMLSISKLDQPIQLVLNQARAAKLGVNIHPVSEKSNKETAEVLQGLYQRIVRDSNADQARLWALQRAVVAGRGWYRINTKWDEDSDPKYFDQEIVIERILHQDSVYADPSAQKPDFSDGEWAFVTSWIPWDTFCRQYPESKLAKETKGGLGALWTAFSEWITNEPEWVRGDAESKAVLVCEYFYKVHDTETIEAGGRKRERDIVSVKWAKLTGYEVLEEEDWDGQYIPLVPVIGRELQPVDGERWWVGMVRHARDAQRFFNYAASALVERMGMEPKTPWVMAEGQDEGHEQEWNESNIRNRPVLHYKPTALGEKLAPPPQRAQLDQTGMSIAMQGVQVSDEWLQANTSVYAPALGRPSRREESGRKVLALQGQSDAGTSHFLDSMADVSMPCESRILLDLMPTKYDRPGRITQILGDEDKTKTVMLNQRFVMDQNGRPIPAPPGDQNAKLFNFADRGYTTSVSVGRSFQTRLQEGREAWSELIPHLPPQAQIILLPTLMRFLDSPGSKEAADLMAKFRDMQFEGLADNEDGASPEQMRAQLQAGQQQMQVMQAQLQQAVEMIQTDRAKQEGMLQKAQMDNEAKVALAKIQAETATRQDEVKLLIEEMRRGLEIWQTKFEAAHEVGMAAAGGNTMTMKREGGQETGEEREDESSQGRSSAPEAEA
jgi:hypothetical protein